MKKVVVIGGRGYTGSELVPMLWRHPECELVAVGSSSAAGQSIASSMPSLENSEMRFSDLSPQTIDSVDADAYILALPNDTSQPWVDAIGLAHKDALIIDLSADHRFDDQWVYGQPEWFSDQISQSRRIANPGCYATAMMLALQPLRGLLASTPVAFGVSGFSGAGRSPSRRNDPDVLKDNILPYKLNDHIHEQEVSRHLDHKVRFLPHVASFFRGINMSISASLEKDVSHEELLDMFRGVYSESRLVEVSADIPEVREVAGTHRALIGGFSVGENSPGDISLVCVLDNLLKGAATQAVQNLNLVFGLEPMLGIEQ